MEELFFLVEEDEDGGYNAKGLGVNIFTQGDDLAEVKAAILDAVHCHFYDNKKRIIRLHIVRQEVLAS